MGYYLADEELFHRITKATGAGNNRHPLTYILEAADDIAYKTADIEDAFVKGFISYHQLESELVVLEKETKILRSNRRQNPAVISEGVWRSRSAVLKHTQ